MVFKYIRVMFLNKSRLLGVACTLLAFSNSNTFAYTVRAEAQALSIQDPSHVIVINTDIDGLTSISATAGAVTSNQGGGTATAFASVDLATGKLRGSGTVIGAAGSSIARADTLFQDVLSFSLPQGLTSATIGFSLTVDGTYTATPFAVSSGFAEIALGGVSVNTGSATTLNNVFGQTLSGQVQIFGDTDLFLSSRLTASILPGSSGNVSFDYLNTGTVSLNLPAGVTYTSESGVFLTAVPIPAAFWLFGSGFIGLIGLARRKART